MGASETVLNGKTLAQLGQHLPMDEDVGTSCDQNQTLIAVVSPAQVTEFRSVL